MEGVPGEVTAFLLVMYLLPGFLGLVVHDFLAEAKKPETFGRFIAALSLALLSNIIVGYLSGTAIDLPKFGEKPELGEVVTAFVTRRLLWLTIVSSLIGLVVAFINNKRWLYRLAQKIKLSDRSGRIDVWREVFHTHRGKWLHLHFKDGRRLLGWPRVYSEYGEDREMFLARAVWYVPVETAPGGPAASRAAPQYDQLEVTGPGTYVGNFDEVLGIDVLD